MHVSHHENYRKNYQGKYFKVVELDRPKHWDVPNRYELGTLDSVAEKVTVTWWMNLERSGRQYQTSTEYELVNVLKYLITGEWKIIK